jgi:hypothetical protein
MDDVFVAPVMSVNVQREVSTTTPRFFAKPTKVGSDWLALAFPADASASEIARWRELGVGDVIRVGTAGTGGFTGFVSVLEVLDADRLYNTAATSWQIATLDPDRVSTLYTMTEYLPDAQQGTRSGGITHLGDNTTFSSWAIEHASDGLPIGSLRCVRINYSIDATSLDAGLIRDLYFPYEAASPALVTDSTRGEVSAYYPKTGTRNYAGADRREMFFYPCYKQRGWGPTDLRISFSTQFKQVKAIKLVGYSLVHKPAAGAHQAHESKEDDWLAIRVKELNANSSTVSNNRHADGALHVLQCGKNTEYHAYEPNGLACMSFTPANLSSLTVSVVDRQGIAAHFGRMHIWLRVLATRG